MKSVLIMILAVGIVVLAVLAVRRLSVGREHSTLTYYAVLFAASFLARGLFVLLVKTEQYSDFQLLWYVANEIARGTPKYLDQRYFSLWAYQTAFPAVMSPFVKLLPGGVDSLLLVNCAFMALNNLCIFYNVNKLGVSKRAAFVLSLLYLLVPYPYALTTVFTNQHLASLLNYLGICFLLSGKDFALKSCILGGLFIAFGNIIRPEGVLSVAAAVCLFAFTGKKLPEKAVSCLSFLAVYFLAGLLASQLFIVTGLNPKGLTNEIPMYKFVVGLNYESIGRFTDSDATIIMDTPPFNESKASMNEKAVSMIRERLSSPVSKLAVLAARKANIMWTAADTEGYPVFQGRSNSEKSAFAVLDSLVMTALFGLAAVFFFITGKRGNLSPAAIFLAAFILATVCAFLAVEVQRRYGYILMPALFIAASTALHTGVLRKKNLDYPHEI